MATRVETAKTDSSVTFAAFDHTDNNLLYFADGQVIRSQTGPDDPQILFGQVLMTPATAGTTKGDATFKSIASFVQIGLGFYIVDTDDHCIRLAAGLTNTDAVTVVAGECGTQGTDAGAPGTSRLTSPYAAIANNAHASATLIYFTETGTSGKLRVFDIATHTVTDIVTSTISGGAAALAYKDPNDFTSPLLLFGAAKIEKLVLGTSASVADEFTDSDIASYSGIVHITGDIYIVSDSLSRTLFIIDITDSAKTRQICDGSDTSTDGPPGSCTIQAPNAILKPSAGSPLVVGSSHAIRTLPGTDE